MGTCRYTKILNGGGMECVVWYVRIHGRLDDMEFKKSRYTTLLLCYYFVMCVIPVQ